MISGAVAAAAMISACSGSVSVNTNANTANANKTAVVTNSNANTNAATPAANTNANTNATSNTAAATKMEGDVVNIDEAGVTMTIPKGFKHSKDGEDIIVQTEDEGVDIRFTVPKDGDYNKVITEAASEIDDYLKDVKIEDKGSKIDVNGMEGTSMNGTATNDGEAVNWDLTIINAPKKPVLVNIYAEKASLEKELPKVQAFLKSVKKQ